MCYGLRVDFQGKLFPGSAALLALADEMREIRTICHCGKKATMVIRQDENGQVIKDGAQVQIGGNETYVSLCRRHWRESIGDKSQTQHKEEPLGAGLSGTAKITEPDLSIKPNTRTSDIKGPICLGGKLTTPITCFPFNFSTL